MKKLTLLITVALFASVACFAQKNDNKFKLSIGPELAFTTGSFSNTHSIGIGGTAQIEINIQDKFQGVAYGGLIFYNGKSAGPGLKNKGVTIVPIRVGVKYFFVGNMYGGFQTGFGFIQGADTYTYLNNVYSYHGTALSYSPQIGYEFNTKSERSFDVTLKYDGYAKSPGLGSFGLRFAYIF